MSGVSVTVGLLSLLAAFAIATFGAMQWPRLVVALTLTGVAGLVNGTFGPQMRQAVATADGTASGVIGRFTGATVTGVVGVLVIAFLVFRVWHNNIDTRTLAAAAAAPLVVTLIPGTLGAIAVTVIGIVPRVVSAVVGFMFGIG